MRTVHVELLEGLGDEFTSPGMITIRDELLKISHLTAGLRHWNEWQIAGSALRVAPDARAVIGYSNGASEVTNIAAMDVPIDLLISLDPTIWLAMQPLHKNVVKAICFHNVNPASSFPPVGHASLTTAPDFTGKLTTIDTWDLHGNVDTDPEIQGACILAVRALANS